MKECDIFRGSKHTLTPPTYFQGVRTPLPPLPHDLRPLGLIRITGSQYWWEFGWLLPVTNKCCFVVGAVCARLSASCCCDSSRLVIYYLRQEGYVFIEFVCLFVCLWDYAKLLNRLSQRSAERWHVMGHRRKRLIFCGNPDHIALRLGLGGDRCASGCVVECRICNREVAGSNLGRRYFAPRSTQPSIPPGSVNEYRLRLGRQR